jgi:DNA repair exonuclease SbcCD ATPase subunit
MISPDKTMTKDELEKFSTLDDRLTRLEHNMEVLKDKVDRIYRALIGDIEGNITGLMHEHRSCHQMLESYNARLQMLEIDIAKLKSQRTYLVAWVAGAGFVVSLGWAIASKLM